MVNHNLIFKYAFSNCNSCVHMCVCVWMVAESRSWHQFSWIKSHRWLWNLDTILVICKHSKCSQPPNHHSSPIIYFNNIWGANILRLVTLLFLYKYSVQGNVGLFLSWNELLIHCFKVRLMKVGSHELFWDTFAVARWSRW